MTKAATDDITFYYMIQEQEIYNLAKQTQTRLKHNLECPSIIMTIELRWWL
jgi:hypothetical protein